MTFVTDSGDGLQVRALGLDRPLRASRHTQGSELRDQQQIEEGRAPFERSLALHGSGPYVIQAAIADLHLPRDWNEIALLHQRLEDNTNSPVVTMNRAIAVVRGRFWPRSRR